jgi:endonuclease III related protein
MSDSPALLAERARLMAVYRDLDIMHGPRGWHWWPDADPFEVIVGAILVQNTMWSNVERALERLRAAEVLTPDAMGALSIEELQELVRPSGQYRQKALKLTAFLALIKEHGGLEALLALDQATLRTRLLATWGIGPETADCIILYAARQPRFIVDAYLIRLFTRLRMGPVETTNYDAWQRYFESALAVDRDEWSRFRAEIVLHCKYLCLKNRPKCGECLLFERCPGSPMRADGDS